MSLSTRARCCCSCSWGRASASAFKPMMMFFFPVFGSVSRRIVISAMLPSLPGYLLFVAHQFGQRLGVDYLLFQKQIAQSDDERFVLVKNLRRPLSAFFDDLPHAVVKGLLHGGGKVRETHTFFVVEESANASSVAAH